MADASGKFRPPRRKLWLYSAIVAGFVLLCSGYLFVVSRYADEQARSTLREWTGTIREQISNHVFSTFKDMKLLLLERNIIDPDADGLASVNKGRLLAALRSMNLRFAQSRFFYADADGILYDSGAVSLGRAVSRAVLRRCEAMGYAVTTLYDIAAGRREVAEIIPVAAESGLYLVRAGDIGEFCASLLAGLSTSGDYYCMFDIDLRRTADLARTDAGAGPEVGERLARGLADFLHRGSGVEIRRVGLAPNYNFYMRLEDFEGWVFAGYIDARQILPFYSDMLVSSLVIFALLLFLIVLIILLDAYNDRHKNREIHKISSMDFLTGLHNELGFQSAMKDFFSRTNGVGNSMVAIDIAAFHRFNSMYGYSAGDKLLRVVGSVIAGEYRHGARISGDVFVCLTPSDPGIAGKLDEEFRDAVDREIGWEYLPMVAFKYGVYPLTERDNNFGDAYDACMVALKKAKKVTSKKEVVYDDKLREQAELQKKIEMNMLHAISKEEFLAYVQPKYDAERKACAGGEVLVRWQSETAGVITPDHFIPLFEHNGFIAELDFFMLGGAFETLKRQLDCGVKPLPLSVNQSRVTLAFPNYLERIRDLVDRYGVPVRHLELEITETFLDGDRELVVGLMHALREMGFSIAMDDFGSGYSSLNTLRELPVDVLKIDKGFLRESTNSERSRTIIRTVINMSRDLGIDVICEGVETQEQFEFLIESGCRLIQGYYYAKPIPAADFERKYLNFHGGAVGGVQRPAANFAGLTFW